VQYACDVTYAQSSPVHTFPAKWPRHFITGPALPTTTYCSDYARIPESCTYAHDASRRAKNSEDLKRAGKDSPRQNMRIATRYMQISDSCIASILHISVKDLCLAIFKMKANEQSLQFPYFCKITSCAASGLS